MSQIPTPITEEYLTSKGFVLVNNLYVLDLPNNYKLNLICQGDLYFPSITYPTGKIAQIGDIEIQNDVPTKTIQDARYKKIDSQELLNDFLNYIKNSKNLLSNAS